MSAPVITWFEIPAADYDRSVAFYEALFGVTLQHMEMTPGERSAIFPHADDMASGAITHSSTMTPAATGTLVYLNVGDRLDAMLARVGDLGGAVVQPRMDLPGIGGIAVVLDSEGNRVGLHQPC